MYTPRTFHVETKKRYGINNKKKLKVILMTDSVCVSERKSKLKSETLYRNRKNSFNE